jgi:hypothetical protein
VQHHGYPAPLLDWTYSPYVGAFFAYQKIKNSQARNATADDKVRISYFHVQSDALARYLQPDSKSYIMSAPQQSISTITNIDDIESYIRSKESAEQRYLRVIDLPLGERPHVMRELSVMGITAGSLFPGLDGACEELKERNLDL